MSSLTNQQIHYIKVPQGFPNPKTDFKLVETELDLVNHPLKEDQLVIRSLYISLDPCLRLMMREPDSENLAALSLNKPVISGVVAEVMVSTSFNFKQGDIVTTVADWAQYSVVDAKTATAIPAGKSSQVPLSYYLGVLGMPGKTAYVGLHTVCEPMLRGETIYVSAAAGAVGQVVGQYAKSLGLRVVGSAGTDAKVKYLLEELHFDAAFNYKHHSDYEAVLKETCPEGIDIYFDNVGGKMLDAVLTQANLDARIAACGMISQYNTSGKHEPIYNAFEIMKKQIKFQGFTFYKGEAKLEKAFPETFIRLLTQKQLKYQEDITKGIHNLPTAFLNMLKGESFGKAVVQIADL